MFSNEYVFEQLVITNVCDTYMKINVWKANEWTERKPQRKKCFFFVFFSSLVSLLVCVQTIEREQYGTALYDQKYHTKNPRQWCT